MNEKIHINLNMFIQVKIYVKQLMPDMKTDTS